MRYNSYQTNNYPRRRTVRPKEPEKIGYAKKLIEELLTQLIICTLVTLIIFASQLLKVGGVDKSISKLKSAITYTPSLKEIANEVKEGTNTIAEKMNYNKQVNGDSVEEPIILVDDEVF